MTTTATVAKAGMMKFPRQGRIPSGLKWQTMNSSSNNGVLQGLPQGAGKVLEKII